VEGVDLMNKKYFYVLGLVLVLSLTFIGFSSSLLINTFNNGLEENNLTFTTNENITRYLEINRFANVTSATMNLSGFNQTDIETDQEDSYNDYGSTLESSVDEDFGTSECRRTVSSPLSYIIDENMSIENYTYGSINWTTKGFYRYKDVSHYGYNIIYYYNHTGDAWVILGYSNCGSSIAVDDTKTVNTCNFAIPSEGIKNSEIFIRTNMKAYNPDGEADCSFANYPTIYYEGKLTQYDVENLNNASTTINNTEVWSSPGQFNETNNQTNDFTSTLNTALNNGACDCTGCSLTGDNCKISTIFHSDSAGILKYSALDIQYNQYPKITLESPGNNTNAPQLKTLTCSAESESNLQNLTMYSWNSTGEYQTNTSTDVSNYYVFDGVYDEVNVSHSESLNISENLTISAWVKFDNNTAFDRIIVKSHNESTQPYSMFGLIRVGGTYHPTEEDGQVRLELGQNGIQHVIHTTSKPPIGQWVHIVGIYNGSSAELYYNGSLETAGQQIWDSLNETYVNMSGALDTNDMPLSIGSDGLDTSSNYFNGSIDEVRIFNRSLSPAEVLGLYNMGRFNESDTTLEGIVAEYHFNNNTNLTDSSGNSNDGILINDTRMSSNINMSIDMDFNKTDTYLWNCLGVSSLGLSKWNQLGNFTLNVNIDDPIINLQIDNNSFFDTNESIYLNYTPLHSTQTVDTCELYGNWSGGWSVNQTDTSITEDSINSFVVNLTDSTYLWNVKCNTTETGNSALDITGNRTFTVDTISPTINTVTITTTTGSQTVGLSTNSTDLNLDSCRYTVYNLAGGVDGSNEDIVFNCSESTSFSTSGFATYNLSVIANDSAGNEKTTYTTFTTSVETTGQAGGGSTTVIVGGEIQWIMEVSEGLARYDKNMLQGTSLKLSVQFENIGDSSRELTLVCEDKQGTVCQYVTFPEETFTLPLLKDTKLRKSFKITIPEDFDIGDYQFNIKAVDDLSRSGEITVFLKVSEGGTLTSILTKLGSSTESGIPYLLIFAPVLIFSLIFSSIIFRKVPLRPIWVILVSAILSFGSIVFL